MLDQAFLFEIVKQTWARRQTLSRRWPFSAFCCGRSEVLPGVTHKLKYKMNGFILNFPGHLLA